MNTTTDLNHYFDQALAAGIPFHEIRDNLDHLDNQQAMGVLVTPPMDLTDEQIDEALLSVPTTKRLVRRLLVHLSVAERQRHNPIGHDHHNAAVCPKCSPQREGLIRDHLKLQAEHIRQGNELRAAREEIAALRANSKLAEETSQREQRAERRIREEGAD